MTSATLPSTWSVARVLYWTRNLLTIFVGGSIVLFHLEMMTLPLLVVGLYGLSATMFFMAMGILLNYEPERFFFGWRVIYWGFFHCVVFSIIPNFLVLDYLYRLVTGVA